MNKFFCDRLIKGGSAMGVNASDNRVGKSWAELLSARESAVRFEVSVEFLKRTRRNLIQRMVADLRDDLLVDALLVGFLRIFLQRVFAVGSLRGTFLTILFLSQQKP